MSDDTPDDSNVVYLDFSPPTGTEDPLSKVLGKGIPPERLNELHGIEVVGPGAKYNSIMQMIADSLRKGPEEKE